MGGRDAGWADLRGQLNTRSVSVDAWSTCPRLQPATASTPRSVARRVRSTDIQSGPQDRAEPEGRRLRALRYQACALEDHVYLHPNSVLARTAPEYVVYSEAVSTGKRPYMSTVTEVSGDICYYSSDTSALALA